MPIFITASNLYDYIHCPHRVYLDRYAKYELRDSISPFVKLLWERGYLYEKQIMSELKEPYTDLSSLEAEEKEKSTLEAIRNGDRLIYSGRIKSGNKVGEPDLLRKEDSGYIAGDIKSGAGFEMTSDLTDGKPKKHYAVQLAFYTDILHELGYGIEYKGFIWDINGREITYNFNQSISNRSNITLWDIFKDCIDEVSKIVNNKSQTRPAASSICKLCHWHTLCLKELKRMNDLTLIPELGRQKRDIIYGKIQNLHQLAGVELSKLQSGSKTIFKGIGKGSLQKFQLRARLLSQSNSKPLITKPPLFLFSEHQIFFDVETDPMRDVCYLHGFYVRNNSKDRGTYFSFFADNPSSTDEREEFARAFDFLKQNKKAVIYYYSKYERTVWRKLQQKYPSVCTSDDIEDIFSEQRSVDLYSDVIKKYTEWPTFNYSIKTLAHYLGFHWRDKDPSGASSIEWYHRWVDTKELKIKKRILVYNEDDCKATAILLDGIRKLMDQNRV